MVTEAKAAPVTEPARPPERREDVEPPEPSRRRTYDEVRRALVDDPEFRLLDVLPAASYAQRHIPGALSLPLADLEQRAGSVIPTLGTPVTVYCAGFA